MANATLNTIQETVDKILANQKGTTEKKKVEDTPRGSITLRQVLAYVGKDKNVSFTVKGGFVVFFKETPMGAQTWKQKLAG